MPDFISKIIILALTIVRWVLIIAVLLTIFGLVLPYLSNARSFQYLQPVIDWESYINQTVKAYIPTKIAGFELSRLITLVIAIILIDFTKTISEKVRFLGQKRKMMAEFSRIQKTYKAPEQQDKIALLESKMAQASLSSGKNRQE